MIVNKFTDICVEPGVGATTCTPIKFETQNFQTIQPTQTITNAHDVSLCEILFLYQVVFGTVLVVFVLYI